MKRVLAAIAVMTLACPPALRAQEELAASVPAPNAAPDAAAPTSRPTHGERRERFPSMRERLGTFNPGANEPVTDQDRDEIEKFMTKNSPKRWERFKDLRADRKEKLWSLMRNQLRALQKIKTEDPRVFQLRLTRLPIEDDIFDLQWKLNHGKTGDNAPLKKELKEKISAFMDNSIAEQKLRLDRQAEHLAKQQQELAAAQDRLRKFAEEKNAKLDQLANDVEAARPGVLKDLAGPMFNPRKSSTSDSAATEPSADGSDAGQ